MIPDPRPLPIPEAGEVRWSSNKDRIETGAFAHAARVHWVLMVFVLLATVIGARVWLSLRPPSYIAEAEMVVTPIDREDTALRGLPLIFGLGDPVRTIQTAAAVVESREIAGLAADRLGESWTARRVLESVEIRPQGQTDILEVRATAER